MSSPCSVAGVSSGLLYERGLTAVLRIRAAVMTSATTILALLPVLTSTGRGSDIMVPMAIPTFGGMAVASLTWFVVPVLYCWGAEWRLRLDRARRRNVPPTVPPAQGD